MIRSYRSYLYGSGIPLPVALMLNLTIELQHSRDACKHSPADREFSMYSGCLMHRVYT